ncbi:MAG TPA: fumarylacetoacetate hydrolase family protein [Acidimicrobiales bacterium]|nr:fumarylacetoacetate hydrolase family protein [Acidimicrobiales bacterium]
MKLATIRTGDGRERVAVVLDGERRLLDLGSAHERVRGGESAALASMLALIGGGDAALELARQLVEAAPEEAIVDRSAVTLLAPIPVPPQIRDFLAFEQHLKGAFAMAEQLTGRHMDIPAVWYQQPIYYKANRFSVVGPGAEVRWPSYAQLLDYELELACVIGKPGVDIAPEEAAGHVFGFTIFNDVSARDAQATEMEGQLGPAKGKDFDTGNVLGPWLVTADEVGDPYDLTMVARVNGEEWSRGHSGTMHHRFEDIIAFVSRSETLHPGEILGSGTVGRGCGLELGRFLNPGDVIELEVERIGVLRNRIVKER